MRRFLVIQLCLFLGAWADTYYIDPTSGSMENDGSLQSPWKTIQEVFDDGLIESYKFQDKPAVLGATLVLKNQGGVVKGGDTLILKSGYHGKIDASEYYNNDYIYVIADQNAEPRLESIRLRSSSKWVFKGLFISPEYAQTYTRQTLINIESHGWSGPSHDISLYNNTLFSVQNTDNWDINDWNDLPCNGIDLDGVNMIASQNYLKNVNFGISASGDSAYVSHNVVENFAGDGIRGLGDYSVYEYNTIKNCYDVNDNHDDGFQSWSNSEAGVGTGVVKGVVLRGNTIINYEDPNQPFRGPLQGIGCFDGMFEGWIVENNVIRVDHWHGISFYGAENMNIRNNTVIDLNEESPGPPWIMITDHKNGTVPKNNVMRNNLSTKINESDEGVLYENNIIVDDYDLFFVDFANGNLNLKAESDAVGAGSSEDAPELDNLGNERIPGSIDVGAIAFRFIETTSILREKNIARAKEHLQNQAEKWSYDSGRGIDGRYHPLQLKPSRYPLFSIPKQGVE